MEIKKRKNDLSNQEHEDFIRKKLGMKHSLEKVKEEFDPSKMENKALGRRIGEIVRRKGDSLHARTGSVRNRAALIEYKNSKTKLLESEKKEIDRQNKLLHHKIEEQKLTKMTKKELKKQFRVYESQKTLLRKVHY